MEAKQLRIGNTVIKKGKWHNVTPHDLSTTASDGLIDYLKPIPLTPEILEVCGLEKQSEGSYKIYDLSFLSREPHFKDGYIIANKKQPITTIFYLHQLQNLYYVVYKKELTVNLRPELIRDDK